jgi:hypothetical protein
MASGTMVEDVVRPLTLDSIPGMTQGLEGTTVEGASTLEAVGVVSVDLVEDMAGTVVDMAMEGAMVDMAAMPCTTIMATGNMPLAMGVVPVEEDMVAMVVVEVMVGSVSTRR